MKILQVSSTDLVGKRFNGQYLTEKLGGFGHQAKQLVWKKEGENPDTHEMLKYPGRRAFRFLSDKIEDRLSMRAVLHPSSFFLRYNEHFKESEIVHYHLMYWPNFFSLLAFPQLTRLKPSVWTIHDFWPFTGHCVAAFDCTRWQTGCGGCPYLKTDFEMRHDNTHAMWKLKKKVYAKSEFDIIVSSKFMQKHVEQSPLLNRFRIHQIPFGLDLNAYKPGESFYSRKVLGLPEDHTIISLRAVTGDYKGFEFIKSALRNMKNFKNLTLLTFNLKWQLEEFREYFNIVDLGWVHDEELMWNAYNASDFFLMPSMQESFGMMAMEAMAMGKPVIVYEGTALPEVVGGNEYGGMVAKRASVPDLTAAIEKLVTDISFRKEKAVKARQFAEMNYSIEAHIAKLEAVYKIAQQNFKK